jgi:hypothetical protein
MRLRTRWIGYAGLVVGTAALLSGCDTIKNAAGVGKESPDEFAIATKAPLVIPPDYNLRPPKPGAAATNASEPTDAAQQSLFGADNATIAKAMPGDMSDAEKLLLVNAGVQNTDPSIRQDLATDEYKTMQSSSDDFTNTVLFWQKPSDKDEAVNPDTVSKTPSAETASATPAAAPAPTPAAAKPDETPPPATIGADEKSQGGSSGGWFSWMGL